MQGAFVDCGAHAGSLAGWRCEQCGAALCPACTKERRAGSSTVAVCGSCGGLALAIRERRSVLRPFRAQLAGALGWPATGRGPVAMLLWGAGLFVASFIGGGLVIRALFVGWLFYVTRSTANGEDSVPGAPDFRGFFEDLVAPITRTALATIWIWLPVVLLRWGSERFSAPWPLVVGAALDGMWLVPISLIASSVESSLWHVLNPALLFRYARLLGGDYLAMVAFWALTALVDGGLFALRLFSWQPAFSLVGCVAAVWMPLALFRALGLLLRTRGDEVRYGRPEDYLDPVLGDARPEGGFLEAQPGAALPERRRGSEASQEPVQAIELVDAGGAGALPPLALVRLVLAQDYAAALAVLEANVSLEPRTLSAEGWLALAQAGAASNARTAVLAARKAIDVAPQGPLAPRAWLLAARIYDERLQDRARSDQLLQQLVERFPASEEGAFAARRLAATGAVDK